MNQVVGISPGLILLPAREYVWELKKRVEIKIPNEGLISEHLQPEELAEGVKIVGDDAFIVFDDNMLSLWEIPRILFAHKLYPQLEANQAFNVTTLAVSDSEITIYGEVIESVEAEETTREVL
ncbi:hypothetical protein LCGC14_0987500 [marine sediment metagenome]|uniref:Uncharacterized protein n=1 Tax=marine sediment metagenome TaxID=412755 RepID=A0A0F9QQ86_9ZZZZ